MKKTPLYTYSPVHLEDIYYVKKYRLEAEANKMLTKDDGLTVYKVVTVPESDVDLWKEVYSKVNPK